jgi:hypothetical protein
MQNSQKDTAVQKLNVLCADSCTNFYGDLSSGFKQCWLMKTLTKINPIHRDLLIALIAGFTMAVVIVSAVVIVIG